MNLTWRQIYINLLKKTTQPNSKPNSIPKFIYHAVSNCYSIAL